MSEPTPSRDDPAEPQPAVVTLRRAPPLVAPPARPSPAPEADRPTDDDEAPADPGPSASAADTAPAAAVATGPMLLPSPTPRPHWDPWTPVWLRGLIRLFLLDEHGPMPRTVAAQVGFAAVLMLLQAGVDMLAWTLGLRWVFVDALGPGGWALTVLFAALISAIILIFERFVVTAAVPLDRSPLANKGMIVRIAVVLTFAMVTAIPVEMMIFHDVIQGRIGGEVEGRRVEARAQLLGEVDGAEKALAEEERQARQAVKLEMPELKSEKVDTSDLDARVVEAKAKSPRLEKEAARAKAAAERAEAQAQRDKARLTALLADAPAATRRAREAAAERSRTNAQRLAARATAAADALAAHERGIADLDGERKRRHDAIEEGNEKLRREATEGHQQALGAISTRMTERRGQLDGRRQQIEKMTDVELAAATKRTFQPPGGFARRWQLMHQLEDEDPLFGWTKWAVRALFVGLSLLVLASKSFFHRRTRAYYLGFDPMDPRIGSL